MMLMRERWRNRRKMGKKERGKEEMDDREDMTKGKREEGRGKRRRWSIYR